MVDPKDTATATLPGIKEPIKLGRKPIYAKAMTAAQRKAKQRREQDARINTTIPELWNESDCMRVLTTKKFEKLKEFAWVQLGSIKGYQ